ncbi:oligogalacturonate-specific porin KdgM family protein, partial [Salmonella enterica subsp. enterica serovar Infantis]
MKINKYLLCMVSFIEFSLYLHAATLDYRHEYADRT